LAPAELEAWYAWASDLVAQFQRASSAVEGRHGYLSQLNHCARGTPTQRLKVMTVIHNFDLKRADRVSRLSRDQSPAWISQVLAVGSCVKINHNETLHVS
jgi:hypothetical protein